jgi:hypothetical protein
MLTFGASQAFAWETLYPTCNNVQVVHGGVLGSGINGYTVCVGSNPKSPPTTSASWENQEYHSGTSIIDFKRGSSSKTDPTKTVGTFTTGTGQYGWNNNYYDYDYIQYTYTGGSAGDQYMVSYAVVSGVTYVYYCTINTGSSSGTLEYVALAVSGSNGCPGNATS